MNVWTVIEEEVRAIRLSHVLLIAAVFWVVAFVGGMLQGALDAHRFHASLRAEQMKQCNDGQTVLLAVDPTDSHPARDAVVCADGSQRKQPRLRRDG